MSLPSSHPPGQCAAPDSGQSRYALPPARFWFDRGALRQPPPWPWSWYALYCRRMVDRGTRRVRGGSFLLRRMGGLSRALGIRSEACVRFSHLNICVNFGDAEVLEVLDEAQGIDPQSQVLRACVRPGGTFLDIGANNGVYSLLAATLVGPAGRVIALEPQPEPAALMAKSFAANSMHHATVHQVACSDHHGTATMFIPPTSRCGGLFPGFSAQVKHRTTTVQLVTLDEIVQQQPLPGEVFIKLDAEGSEYAVLEGARQVVAERRPTILIELNPASARAAGRSTAEIVDLLRRLGYAQFSFAENFPEPATAEELEREAQRNVVARV